MKKGHEIIGLRVLSQTDGADLGHVRDLIFDHDTNELLAILISEKDLFGLIDAQVVPWDQVRSIGPNAVMVDSASSKINAGDSGRVRAIMERKTALSGTRIFTTDGRDLGTLADMYFDETTGHIVGYEVSTGFLSDTMSGKRFLPADTEISLGDDVALVPPEAAHDLERQAQEEPGGLTATYNSAKDKISETYSNIASASVEKQKEWVVGKTAGRDVIIPADKLHAMDGNSAISDSSTMSDNTMAPEIVSGDTAASTSVAGELPEGTSFGSSMATQSNYPVASEYSNDAAGDISSSGEAVDGEVLVRQGEVITREHADRAEQHGILHNLVVAAGGGAIGEKVSAGQDAAGGHLSGAQERAEEAAIGRPAGREVRSDDGRILVAPGQVVTRELQENARSHGKDREVIAAAGVGAASEAAGAVKERAVGVWDTLKEKVSELTGAAQDKKAEYDEQALQSKIENALGRPVTRVILAQDDSVILNTGDLITHAAIERARQEDALDMLLDSVYTAEPEITPEMLRAREPGEAALPSQAQPSGGPITATVAPEGDGNSQSQSTPSQG